LGGVITDFGGFAASPYRGNDLGGFAAQPPFRGNDLVGFAASPYRGNDLVSPYRGNDSCLSFCVKRSGSAESIGAVFHFGVVVVVVVVVIARAALSARGNPGTRMLVLLSLCV
jgi:hypothetical protein